MTKRIDVLVIAFLLVLLAACGTLTPEGLVIRSADPNLAILVPLQQPLPLPATPEPEVVPATATLTPTAESLLPTVTPTPGCVNAKGNISATGEKIYHCPGQANYNNVKIDKEGEAIFATEQEAIDAGFRKALR